MDTFADHDIDRRPLASTLEDILTTKKPFGVTVGLNGEWGSGKTSVLNVAVANLQRRGFILCTVSGWEFSNPNNVLEGILKELHSTISRVIYLPELSAYFERLTGALIQRDQTWSQAIFSSFTSSPTVSEYVETINARMGILNRPVILIIDDLDRLDKRESRLTLRALNHFHRLTHVHKVIAYDRARLERMVNPQGDSNESAIQKIVHLELSLSTPSEHQLLGLLDHCLEPIYNSMNPSASEIFKRLWYAQSSSIFTVCLQTPRNVKRICVRVALAWNKLSTDLNLFDLLALSVIHERFPDIYRKIHKEPYLFVSNEWGQNSWMLFNKEELAAKRSAYFERLSANALDGLTLLAAIFPAAATAMKNSVRNLDANTARAERRIFHPDNFQRYFALDLAEQTVSQTLIEKAAESFLAIPDSVGKRRFIAALLQTHAQRDAMPSFLDNWKLFLAKIEPAMSGANGAEVIEPIVLGFADSSKFLSSKRGTFLLSDRTRAGYDAIALISRLDNPDLMTALMVNSVRNSTSIGYCDMFVFYPANPERAKELFKNEIPDLAPIQEAFDSLVRSKYRTEPGILFESDEEELVAVIYRFSDNSIRVNILKQSLLGSPQSLGKVINFFVNADYDERSGLHILEQRFAELIKLVPAEELMKLIETCLPSIKNKRDLALINRLCDWLNKSAILGQ